MQAVILVGGRGDAAAAADVDGAQDRRAARRPAAHRLHARVAARPRRRRRDHVVRLPRDRRARRARRRVAARHPAALRRGARAARHRRRAEVRRGAARRALPDAQRRRPHRPRPQRADRPARGDRRGRHARARAGPGPVELRAREPARRQLGRGVPREAVARRADHDEPHLGGRLRPRALGARPHPARRRRSRSSARSGPRSSITASTASPTTRPTGSTSARPRATCR